MEIPELSPDVLFSHRGVVPLPTLLGPDAAGSYICILRPHQDEIYGSVDEERLTVVEQEKISKLFRVGGNEFYIVAALNNDVRVNRYRISRNLQIMILDDDYRQVQFGELEDLSLRIEGSDRIRVALIDESNI